MELKEVKCTDSVWNILVIKSLSNPLQLMVCKGQIRSFRYLKAHSLLCRSVDRFLTSLGPENIDICPSFYMDVEKEH
jgi:hypothetical protein